MPRPSETTRRRPEAVSRSTRALTVATAGSARRASGANETGMPSLLTSDGGRREAGLGGGSGVLVALGAAPEATGATLSWQPARDRAIHVAATSDETRGLGPPS